MPETPIFAGEQEDSVRKLLAYLPLNATGADAVAWHLEQGQDNGGISREALAAALRGYATNFRDAIALLSRTPSVSRKRPSAYETCRNCGGDIYYDYDGNWQHIGCKSGPSVSPQPADGQANSPKKRSNHFSDEVIDKGFPDHISRDGDAYYRDGTVLCTNPVSPSGDEEEIDAIARRIAYSAPIDNDVETYKLMALIAEALRSRQAQPAEYVRGLERAWPLVDVLERFVQAVEHLREAHGCDCHGYEVVLAARDSAKQYIAGLRQAPVASETEGER